MNVQPNARTVIPFREQDEQKEKKNRYPTRRSTRSVEAAKREKKRNWKRLGVSRCFRGFSLAVRGCISIR